MYYEAIRKLIEGDVQNDEATLKKYSRDASLFEIQPEVVVFPKNVEDVKKLVRFVRERREEDPDAKIYLTPRSAGTDMTGGPLGESIILDFTRYFNRIKEVGELAGAAGHDDGGYAVAEPGVYYRDFEKETLKQKYFLPSYPASRELCALGGMVANNSGGEKTLAYGKTQDYILELKVVFEDGEEYTVKPLTQKELEIKTKQKNFEGAIYRKLQNLIEKNYEVIQDARPKVSKNSSGYDLWDVWDKKRGVFDLAKLIVGSQGTLGIVTEITFRLVKTKPYSGMLVAFLDDLHLLGDITNAVLPFHPTSFESFDDHTLRLAMKFFTGFLKLLGAKNMFSLALKFLPEFWFVVTHGVPKLVLLVEFEETNEEAVQEKLLKLNEAFKKFKVITKLARTKEESKKYWAIRRESFNLLRNKVKNKQTAPFIDDLVVLPERLPEFLPKLYAILDKYKLLYTIAGHVGNGNFHIIPLMTLANQSEREKIPHVAGEVFDLILQFKGSLTGEHNDGLIRSPYLRKAFGDKAYALFEETKRIFDPLLMFNPGKKVGADLKYALAHLKRA